jgi:restriction system protein
MEKLMVSVIQPRAPHYPIYQTTSDFLELVDGVSVKILSDLLKQIDEHKGTPQSTNDWSNPDAWIDALLSPNAAQLAHHFWDNETVRINPRYIGDQLRFSKMYSLLREEQGNYRLSPRGQAFLSGELFEELDYSEGLIKLLSILADLGTGKRSDFLPPFGNFLKEHSNIKSNTVIDSYWYYRMRNLVYRGYAQNTGNNYQITELGLKYLQSIPDKIETPKMVIATKPLLQLQKLQLEQTKEVRQQIAEALARMNPYVFEAFVGQLLQAMGYQNVLVTQKSNDKGVDVIAEIEVGITLVKEVVQVKRYNKSTVGDKEVNELRGRLPRFGALRGTIITNSKFSKAAQESSFLGAPITLIDGERLISLMMEYNIGVEYEEIKIPKFNPNDFDYDEESLDKL